MLGRAKRLNLALQGGGAHGAFTWGVLDALLESGRLRFEGISGTSAGAVNAVSLAFGLMEGGPDKARSILTDVWSSISQSAAPDRHPATPLAFAPAMALTSAVMRNSLQHFSNLWSPYDLNPLDINPLREILLARIDFERLRHSSPVELFLAATEVTSGRARIFRTHEISVDAVLASACLPTLFPAIQIGRFRYWDGGFSANPDLICLIKHTSVRDTLLVLINPDRDPALPVSKEQIAANISRLTFNQPLRSQIEQIELHRWVPRLPVLVSRDRRRIGAHRFHLVDGSRYTVKLSGGSKLQPDWQLITSLHDKGRLEAEHWLETQFKSVERRSSVDLYAKYFKETLPFD